MADDSSTNNNDGVFIYTEGSIAPIDVVRVRIHPSVTVISGDAFHCRDQLKLKEIELCEGLLEIGEQAFRFNSVLEDVNIPSTVRVIRYSAFSGAPMSISGGSALPNGLEIIDNHAFNACGFTTLRIPPLVSKISRSTFYYCKSMLSLELPNNVNQIEQDPFSHCHSLRNVAFPPSIEVGDEVFSNCTDLHQLFDSVDEPGSRWKNSPQAANALKHRFDNLPIHKMIYYQSYNNVTLDELNTATDIRISQRRSKLNPSGKQQDCLGMTPLHIMACSTVQNIELYRVLVSKYPETLITEDRWETLPLLYAVWGQAPDEIVEFLVESYQSIYPNYELDWTEMVKTLGKANVPPEVIQRLLEVQNDSFPDQMIDLEDVIEDFAKFKSTCGYEFSDKPSANNYLFQLLVKYCYAERVKALGLKQWRDYITNRMEDPSSRLTSTISSDVRTINNRNWLNHIRSKLSQYEDEYSKLKEATSLLELTLWKMELNDQTKEERQNKKMKIDREQYRISCGADTVIQHVLPYLLADEIETIDDSSESEVSESGYL